MHLNFNFVYRHIQDGLKMVEEENIDRKLWPEVITKGLMNDWEQCLQAEMRKMSDMALALVKVKRPTHYWACTCDACSQDVTREGRETDA